MPCHASTPDIPSHRPSISIHNVEIGYPGGPWWGLGAPVRPGCGAVGPSESGQKKGDQPRPRHGWRDRDRPGLLLAVGRHDGFHDLGRTVHVHNRQHHRV